jgi:beta-glucosidase
MRLITNSFLAMGMCLPLALANAQEPAARQTQLGSRDVPLITVDGLRFRDLNRDGKLEPYEDWRIPAQQRATIWPAACRSKRRQGS